MQSLNGFNCIYTHASGGKIWQHNLVNASDSDYEEILEISIDKADLGYEIHILPVLNKDDPLRDTIYNGAKERKCPDIKINGEFAEIKTPTKSLHDRKINKNIRLGHEQANRVIIKLCSEYNIQH